jgi:hypothetical protein
MKETHPTIDMGGSGGHTPGADGPKTVMAGPEKPRPAPTEGGGPLPWTPPPPPPPPPAAPAPFQPVPAPAPAPASGGARTVLMGTPVPQIKLAWLGVVSGPGAERGQTFVLRVETGRRTSRSLCFTTWPRPTARMWARRTTIAKTTTAYIAASCIAAITFCSARRR